MNNIEKYLNNKLSEKETELITKTIVTNAFKEELKEDWNRILEEKYKVIPPHKKRFKFSIYYKVAAVAATVLFVFLAGQTFLSSTATNQQELLATYLEEPYNNKNSRKGDVVASIRTSATNAYISQDYQQAIQYYEQITNSEKSDIADHFYLGLSYLYNNQSESAIEVLLKAQSMPKSVSFRSKEEVNWYLSLAYLKAEQSGLAKKELNAIVTENGYYSAKAKELLSTIE